MRPLLALSLTAATLLAQPFDLVIAGARIVDGSGNPWFRADIGILNGRIHAIGSLGAHPARRVIRAPNLVVMPGFIDMMGANSEPLLDDRTSAESKLRQGITTMLAGEGGSVAPSRHWPRFATYFAALEKHGVPLNVIHNVGAAQIRRHVIGVENRRPTPAELQHMRKLVEQAMTDGAVGLSTALIYPPGTYATTGELVEMAKVVARFNGIYFTHMRNESHALLDAIRESMLVGQRAGIPVHIFHLKAAGQENWPLFTQAIDLIQSARDRGFDVTADIYPYIRNGLGLTALVHPRHFSQGAEPFLKTLSNPAVRAALRQEIEQTADWENWYRHAGRNWDNILVASVGARLDKNYEGKSIAQIARLRQQDEWSAFFDLLATDTVSVNPVSMNEQQKHLALRTPWVSLCTDAPPVALHKATGAHPRAFGSFPRVLAKYVRDENIIPLEMAVRKMTSLAANRLGLFDRGRIAPGLWADLVLVDLDKVQDKATFTQPLAFPDGIPYVIVNGVVAIDDGRFSPHNAGHVLRHNNRRSK
jgi:N-acyl-D-aspartate/D-glutamate deacylase